MPLVTALILLVTASAAAAPCPDTSSPELPKIVLPSLKARTVEVKPWKKDFCVALFEATQPNEKSVFALALFAAGEGDLASRLKASTGPIELDAEESLLGLDLAKYDVKPTETAIGVRLQRTRSYAGNGEATLTLLALYLPHGRKLEHILGTYVAYESNLAGDWGEDGVRDHVGSSDQATLIVSKKKTKGYFDLIRKTGAGTQHLRWDGYTYEEVDADPFKKSGLEILSND
jgi:hypothetical protein